jgi:tetratricopeptide (TPR) repeat protein
MDQGAPRQAQGFYSQALELLPPVERARRWQALLGREEALTVLSDAEPRKADISALLELARTLGDDEALAEAYFRQAFFGSQISNWSIMDQALPQALAYARGAGNQAIEARALILNATLNASRAIIPATTQYAEEALQLARHLEDESVLAFVLLRSAWAYGEIGETARAKALQTEQVELDHRLGNRDQEATGLGNLGAGYLGIGMYKQARSLLEQSRAIQEALGAKRSLAYDLGNLGDLSLETGELRQARQFLEHALQEISPSQDDRGRYWLTNDIGLVLLAMGDASSASRYLVEAQQLAQRMGHAAMGCEATIGLAACAVAQGQLDEARQYIHEAWVYLKEHSWFGMNNPGKDYRMCIETFDALGETENAGEVLEIAHQAMLDYVNKFDVPEWRRSFLENVPDNRAVMEMWERRKG